jgi:hypothetical protein
MQRGDLSGRSARFDVPLQGPLPAGLKTFMLIFSAVLLLYIFCLQSRDSRPPPALPLDHPLRAFNTPLPVLAPVPAVARRVTERPWRYAIPADFTIQTEFGPFCSLCGRGTTIRRPTARIAM